jgi:hypothetical protein
VLQSAKQEVAHVIICQGDEWVDVGVLPVNVDVLNGEELMVVAVEEDDRC